MPPSQRDFPLPRRHGRRPAARGRGDRRIAVAHPSPDVYGSDLQLLESVDGLVRHDWHPIVMLPDDGPLRPLLEGRGADVRILRYPVLRRALLRPVPLARFVVTLPATVWRLRTELRRSRASVVYVNTLTVPVWVAAARLAGLPVLCHSHEAEVLPTPVQLALGAPLLLADRVIANSRSTRAVLTSSVPGLSTRIMVIPNGVPDPGPPAPPRRRDHDDDLRLVLVSRLSPRKGIHVALDALATLRSQGRRVTLDVCGTTYPGYEWYERDLRRKAEEQGTTDAVTFHGYVAPTRPMLEAADIVLVPSFGESFGNVAVEGMLAGRPVVASNVQGLSEIIDDGRSGVLVETGSADALAAAVAALADDPGYAVALATTAREEARDRFAVTEYQDRIAKVVESVAGVRERGPSAGDG